MSIKSLAQSISVTSILGIYLSRTVSSDQVWYFFGRKESKYNRGERLKRKTKSGFWKKTGVALSIKRKSGNREKIGEKRVLVFYKNGSKSNWVMHEYHASCFSPSESGKYTICKVQFKGEAREIYSSGGVEHRHSLATPMNNLGGSEFAAAEIQMAFDNLSSYDWKSLLDDDDDEQSKTASMQKSVLSVVV